MDHIWTSYWYKIYFNENHLCSNQWAMNYFSYINVESTWMTCKDRTGSSALTFTLGMIYGIIYYLLMSLLRCPLAGFQHLIYMRTISIISTNVTLDHPEFKGFLSLDVCLEFVGVTYFSVILLCDFITIVSSNLLKFESSTLINKNNKLIPFMPIPMVRDK